jgi:hypothetical protein
MGSALRRYSSDPDSYELLANFSDELEAGRATPQMCEQLLFALSDGRPYQTLPEYVELRRQLRRFAGELRAAAEPDFAEDSQEHSVAFQEAVRKYRDSHNLAAFAEAQRHYAWLLERNAAAAAEPLWKELHQPNVHLRISAQSGSRILPNPLAHRFQHSTALEGYPANVTGHLVARARLHTPADGSQVGHGGIDVGAHVQSTVVVQRDRITLKAAGVTQIDAQVLLTVRGNNFAVAGTSLTSRTSMQLANADSASRLRIVDQITRRAAQREFDRRCAELNAEADRQLAAQGKPALVGEVAKVVEQINTGKNEVIAPLLAYGLEPQLGITSDAHGLVLSLLVAMPEQLGAPSDAHAPRTPGGSSITVHESAANNAASRFAGRTLDDSQFRATVFDSLGFSASDLPPQETCRLTFAKEQPLLARFDAGGLDITMNVTGVEWEGEKLTCESPVKVRTKYVFRLKENTVRVEHGPLECSEGLSPLVLKAAERFLVPVATQSDFTTLGQLLQIVRLRIAQPQVDGGWLTLPLIER